jgi:hypothetical protein
LVGRQRLDLSLLKILEMSERPVVRKFEKAKPQANRFRNCGKILASSQ